MISDSAGNAPSFGALLAFKAFFAGNTPKAGALPVLLMSDT